MSNYAQIRSMDVSNGEGVGVSIFFSGCDHRCKNCFNSELWDYDYGKPFTDNEIQKIVELMDKPHITRLSILGGDGLMSANLEATMKLIKEVKTKFGDTKNIWLYTGYTWDYIFNSYTEDNLRQQIVEMCDVLVDGRYIDGLRDLTLQFKGSSNQRVIDVKKSLETNNVILYELD